MGVHIRAPINDACSEFYQLYPIDHSPGLNIDLKIRVLVGEIWIIFQCDVASIHTSFNIEQSRSLETSPQTAVS